jgi:antitoxin (DNA-binding transcriptional repressor) of toxin-antitoxin stability system
MSKYLSAKDFRQRFPNVIEDLKQWGEIIVLKRSKPLFRVLPFEESPRDLLERAAAKEDSSQPDLQEISRIVHKLREA